MAYKLKIGPNVSTTDHRSLSKTTPAKVKQWWEDVKQNIPNYTDFNWSIVGGMANGSQESNDADITLTSLDGNPFPDLGALQSTMCTALELALNNHFFLDISGVPYLWETNMGVTKEYFKIVCWAKAIISVDEEEGVWRDQFFKDGVSFKTVFQIEGHDLWIKHYADRNGELFYPFGGDTTKAATYTIPSISVEDWVAQLDI